MIDLHREMTAAVWRSGKSLYPNSCPGLTISIPIERELMSVSPAHDDSPACQARLSSGHHLQHRASGRVPGRCSRSAALVELVHEAVVVEAVDDERYVIIRPKIGVPAQLRRADLARPGVVGAHGDEV